MAIAIPAVLRASLLQPGSNAISREAGIAKSGIGFSGEAIRGYINILTGTVAASGAGGRCIVHRSSDARAGRDRYFCAGCSESATR
jgi:hypothetical protein